MGLARSRGQTSSNTTTHAPLPPQKNTVPYPKGALDHDEIRPAYGGTCRHRLCFFCGFREGWR